MLDVRRVRLLHALSLHGTVSATAEALHLSGPAVSQQLAALEREAGLPLLEKRGRTLSLTPAGERLVAHAEVILGTLAAAEADLQALREGSGGLVRIAAFPSAARVLLPRVWRRDAHSHVRQHPRLGLVEAEPDQAVEALRRHQADLAVIHAYSLLPRPLPPGCEQHHLADDPVLLALPKGRGPAAGRAVELADFAGDEWLMPGQDTSCHELTRRACGAAGFVPSPTALASDFSVITALVAAGAGVALVPRMALPDVLPAEIVLHPLATPVTRTISALTRTGEARLPALAQVIEALRAAGSAVA